MRYLLASSQGLGNVAMELLNLVNHGMVTDMVDTGRELFIPRSVENSFGPEQVLLIDRMSDLVDRACALVEDPLLAQQLLAQDTRLGMAKVQQALVPLWQLAQVPVTAV